MDYKNVQSARREGMMDYPSETDIDYEKEVFDETDSKLKSGEFDETDTDLKSGSSSGNSEEYLKKLGRQTEV